MQRRGKASAQHLSGAEVQTGPLKRKLAICSWQMVLEADAKLHDFLCATLGREAGLMADIPGLQGQGFEVWRMLTEKHAPTGGQCEIDSLIPPLTPEPAQDMNALLRAIATSRFEHK